MRPWLPVLLLVLLTVPAPAEAASSILRVPADRAATGLVLRVRAERCGPSPRAVVRVDGRVAARPVVRRSWRTVRAERAIAAGRHRVSVTAATCRTVRVAGVQAVLASRVAARAPAPSLAPAPVAPPPPPVPAPAPVVPVTPAPSTVPRVAHAIPLGTAVFWRRFRDDPALRALLEEHFDSITPENEMKMEALQPQRGTFRFADADELAAYAAEHGKRVRGHTLVWHQQNPSWLTGRAWNADELREVLVTHVRTVAEHFRGRVDTWDVVNEPLHDDGTLRGGNAPWLPVLGVGYIETALRAAREADPDARLFINDYAVEHAGRKLDALVALVADLKSRGVPLDGVGLQNHTNTAGFPDRARLVHTMQRLAALGVEVEITEMDVGTSSTAGTPEQRLARQAQAYADAASACAEVPACKRITTWGMSDRDSWLGPAELALPFDAELQPKPAWHALTSAAGP